jgi:hypothetical protein
MKLLFHAYYVPCSFSTKAYNLAVFLKTIYVSLISALVASTAPLAFDKKMFQYYYLIDHDFFTTYLGLGSSILCGFLGM